MSKPLREAMPTVAVFLDECRAAFGEEVVNAQIRQGMRGKPTFYACENGIEVGTKIAEPKVVSTTVYPPRMPYNKR